MLLTGLCLAVITLVAATLFLHALRRPEERAITAIGAVTLIAGFTAARSGPYVPDGVITVLQEGMSHLHIQQLYGRGMHAGSFYTLLLNRVSPAAAGDGLRAVVRMNTALTLMNSVLFLLLASRVVRWPAAFAFMLVFLLNPGTLHTALSEIPAAVLTTLFLLAVAVAQSTRDRSVPVAERAVATGAVLGLAILGGLTRVEMLAISVPTALTVVLPWTGHQQRVERVWSRGVELFARTLSLRLPILACGLVLLTIVLMLVSGDLFAGPRDLFNVSGFSLVGTLFLFLPLGPIALFVAGAIHAFKRPTIFCGLPLSLVILQKVYLHHDHFGMAAFEVLRYTSMFLPSVLFLSLFGWREIAASMERLAWSQRRRAIVRNLTVLSFVCLSPTGALHMYTRLDRPTPAGRGIALTDFTITQDEQREVRYLLEVVRAHPECTLLSRVDPNDTFVTEVVTPITEWNVAVFGAPESSPRFFPLEGHPISDFASRAKGSCVLYYRGLDCDLVRAGNACDQDLAGLDLVDERVIPYSPFYHHTETRPSLRLGLYAVRPTRPAQR